MAKIDFNSPEHAQQRFSDRNSYERTIPHSYKGTYRKAMEGNSLRAGINAKCHNCMGYEDTVRRIRECTGWKICPLWEYRPYQHDEVVQGVEDGN